MSFLAPYQQCPLGLFGWGDSSYGQDSSSTVLLNINVSPRTICMTPPFIANYICSDFKDTHHRKVVCSPSGLLQITASLFLCFWKYQTFRFTKLKGLLMGNTYTIFYIYYQQKVLTFLDPFYTTFCAMGRFHKCYRFFMGLHPKCQ